MPLGRKFIAPCQPVGKVWKIFADGQGPTDNIDKMPEGKPPEREELARIGNWEIVDATTGGFTSATCRWKMTKPGEVITFISKSTGGQDRGFRKFDPSLHEGRQNRGGLPIICSGDQRLSHPRISAASRDRTSIDWLDQRNSGGGDGRNEEPPPTADGDMDDESSQSLSLGTMAVALAAQGDGAISGRMVAYHDLGIAAALSWRKNI